jgi:Flp pilus assembly protein CpaB
VQVYVAAKDVSAGVPGPELMKDGAVRLAEVPRRSVVPGAISNPEQIKALVLSGPLYAGEQVTLRRFTDVAAQGIRAQLKGTTRAVQIAGDPNQVLAGTLQAGDHVDVVANLSTDANADDRATRIVLRDLTVLGIANEGAAAGVAGAGKGVILAVTDTQVQRLFYVTNNADWALQLRPVVDPADSPERVETLNSILTRGI